MTLLLANMDPASLRGGDPAIPWCGHDGDYRVTAFLCGRPASRSDQVVACAECRATYLASELAAARRAAAADPADRCKHELLRADCAHCRPRKPRQPKPKQQASAPQRPESRADSAWITARYGGNCAGCGAPVQPGDEIRRGDWRGWEGRCCDTDVPVPTTTNRKA